MPLTKTGLTSKSASRAVFAGGFAVKLSIAQAPTTKVSVTILPASGHTIATTDVIESMFVAKASGNFIKTVLDVTSGASISATGKVVPGTAFTSAFSHAMLFLLWSYNNT